MNSVNAQGVKIKEKSRNDIGLTSRRKKVKDFAIARSPTASKSTVNATMVGSSVIVIANAKTVKTKMIHLMEM